MKKIFRQSLIFFFDILRWKVTSTQKKSISSIWWRIVKQENASVPNRKKDAWEGKQTNAWCVFSIFFSIKRSLFGDVVKWRGRHTKVAFGITFSLLQDILKYQITPLFNSTIAWYRIVPHRLCWKPLPCEKDVWKFYSKRYQSYEIQNKFQKKMIFT